MGWTILCSNGSVIARNELRTIARARLRDAQILLESKRFDGAFYICGYAVELMLKARICRTLRWTDFPETREEFRLFQSLKTHDLETLLKLSGVEHRVTTRHPKEWFGVAGWNPVKRYQTVGQTTPLEAENMVMY